MILEINTETNTDVACLQMIAKKQVIAKNNGRRAPPQPNPLNPPLTVFRSFF